MMHELEMVTLEAVGILVAVVTLLLVCCAGRGAPPCKCNRCAARSRGEQQ